MMWIFVCAAQRDNYHATRHVGACLTPLWYNTSSAVSLFLLTRPDYLVPMSACLSGAHAIHTGPQMSMAQLSSAMSTPP